MGSPVGAGVSENTSTAQPCQMVRTQNSYRSSFIVLNDVLRCDLATILYKGKCLNSMHIHYYFVQFILYRQAGPRIRVWPDINQFFIVWLIDRLIDWLLLLSYAMLLVKVINKPYIGLSRSCCNSYLTKKMSCYYISIRVKRLCHTVATEQFRLEKNELKALSFSIIHLLF